MKQFIFKSCLLGILGLGLSSCEKSENQVVSDVSPAGTLSSSTTVLNLSLEDGDKTALSLTFPKAEIKGAIIPVESTIQFDVKGNNFANPVEFVQSSYSFSPTVNEVNAMMLKLGLKIGEAGQLEVRLKSAPAANAVTYSNIIMLTGTPYKASSWIYIPAAYQNWSPATADSLLSPISNGVYEGIINFPDTKLEFKITPKKNWTTEYGDAGNNSFRLSGDNFSVLKPGAKKVTIDMNKMKWELTEAKTWSLIGSSTAKGWEGDTDLKFINDGTETHTLTLDLLAGEIKIRYGHDWGVSLGGSVNDFVFNGGNVPIAAGNYTITLNVTKTDDTGKPTAVKITMVKN
ncbi:SusE domain-containing protein [Pedobacter sp. ASV1-7]|uniref:SusE domain-containing protein n=1 Tax=Pedobacter sp. ASV1-7 TaxID=3145237 RepID=UPI0032E86A9D